MRQQVLFLYLQSSALDSQVVAWSSYDGTSEGPTPPVESRPTAPYRTGVDALRDGWREKKFTMNDLSKAAAVCRVSRVIQPYVEMLA